MGVVTGEADMIDDMTFSIFRIMIVMAMVGILYASAMDSDDGDYL